MFLKLLILMISYPVISGLVCYTCYYAETQTDLDYNCLNNTKAVFHRNFTNCFCQITSRWNLNDIFYRNRETNRDIQDMYKLYPISPQQIL
ncbi:hypothetical protein ScPMuIL_013070 [Solemya velum]